MIDHLITIYIDLYRVENIRYKFKKFIIKPLNPFYNFYIKFLYLTTKLKTLLTNCRVKLYNKLTLEL